jgi:probable rRNA maturation factor
MSIDIANESGVEVDEAGLAAVARYALDQLRIHPLAELSVLIVDEQAMTELHERWMGEPGPTDVLSFPMDELRPPQPGGREEPAADPGLLGDVVLCPQVAAQQARTAGHSTKAELELLTVHGVLHLLGYDHAEPEEHAEMFGLQEQLLKSWRDSLAARAEETSGQLCGPGSSPSWPRPSSPWWRAGPGAPRWTAAGPPGRPPAPSWPAWSITWRPGTTSSRGSGRWSVPSSSSVTRSPVR